MSAPDEIVVVPSGAALGDIPLFREVGLPTPTRWGLLNAPISGNNLLQAFGPALTWQTLTTILATHMGNTRGQILRRGASVWEALALGSNGQYLKSNGTDAAWATPTFTAELYHWFNFTGAANPSCNPGLSAAPRFMVLFTGNNSDNALAIGTHSASGSMSINWLGTTRVIYTTNVAQIGTGGEYWTVTSFTASDVTLTRQAGSATLTGMALILG